MSVKCACGKWTFENGQCRSCLNAHLLQDELFVKTTTLPEPNGKSLSMPLNGTCNGGSGGSSSSAGGGGGGSDSGARVRFCSSSVSDGGSVGGGTSFRSDTGDDRYSGRRSISYEDFANANAAASLFPDYRRGSAAAGISRTCSSTQMRSDVEQEVDRLSEELRDKREIMSTRAEFRRAVKVVSSSASKDWKDEYEEARKEGNQLLGRSDDDVEAKMKSTRKRAVELLHEHNVIKGYHAKKMESGLTDEEAQLVGVLMSAPIETAIARALKDETLDPWERKHGPSTRYANLTREAALVLSRQTYRLSHPQEGRPVVIPPVYAILKTGDGKGIGEKDQRWDDVLRPDHTGFCGMTSYAPIPLRNAQEQRYHPEGLLHKVRGGESTPSTGYVICVESDKDPPQQGECNFHAAVLVANDDYILPPLTLLTVKRVADEFEYLPGKVVKQKVIYLRPTFITSRGVREDTSGAAKFCAFATTLSYGSTENYVTSLNPIIVDPVLTMREEWARNDRWLDRNMIECSGKEEWEYVTGPVGKEGEGKTGTGYGQRDGGHHGWSPRRFVDEANQHIRSEAARLGREFKEERDLLNLCEVLAVRLFTGPGFIVINEFLRQLAALQQDYRKRVAKRKSLTYSSTVGHLMNGLRKLARFTELPANGSPLYRAVRGRLPRGVETLRDANGQCVAVEYGFMSTSPDRDVCTRYMDRQGPNVLWELKVQEESDEAFHLGADVAVISQYPQEKEITFPPYTMLVVEPHPDDPSKPNVDSHYGNRALGWLEPGPDGGGPSCLRIVAKPHFI